MSPPICLLTRPAAQSSAFAALLAPALCVISPILKIKALPFDPAVIDAAPGIVFTSANAVPFAGAGRGRPALCVGPQTAAAARAAGFDVTEGPGDAARMMPLLAGREDFLHVHGRHRARTLPLAGIAVYDQTAHPLSPDARALLDGDGPVILPLFSPRSAALLSAEAASSTAPIAVAAISPAADAAYQGPARRRFVAAAPEGEAMAALIRKLAFSGTSFA